MDLMQNRLDEISRNWAWFLALGILLLILGGAIVLKMFSATLPTIPLLGVSILIAGIGQCILAIRAPQWSGFFLNLFSGLLSIVLGYLFIQEPDASSVTLTLLACAFFTLNGLFKIFTAAIHRFHQWICMFINGLATVLMSILLWLQWPVSGLWGLGLLLGIDLTITGSAWLIISLSLRKFSNGKPQGLAPS